MSIRNLIDLVESNQEPVEEAVLDEAVSSISLQIPVHIAMKAAEALNHVGREVYDRDATGQALMGLAREIVRLLNDAGHTVDRRF